MSSFPAQARRARDLRVPTQQRLYALRECTLRCAPYGYRATWHHLIVSARIPQRLDDDPEAIVRAVDELARTRDVVLPYAMAYAARRRREKAAGWRSPEVSAPWNSWGGCRIAYCPDPERHPTGPLAAVVQRVLDGHATGIDSATQCLACGAERVHRVQPCPVCGVQPDGPSALWRSSSEEERWTRIWRRDIAEPRGATVTAQHQDHLS